ncbi:MAG: glycoside hydrolase family 97 protein [Prevotella sp.]|nr:glycoside hydrolase family 97 protein [Prevotella sp.]
MKKTFYCLVLLLLGGGTAVAKDYTLSSPNGKIGVTVSDNGGLHISVACGGKDVVSVAAGMNGKTLRIGSAKNSTVTVDTDAPLYRQPHINLVYRQMDLRLNDGWGLQVRACDEGAAYRFYTQNKGETIVSGEQADFRFPEGAKGWLAYTTNAEKPFAMAFQNTYHETHLVDARPLPAFLPATVEVSEGVKVTILESDLRSYPGMFVTADGDGLNACFAHYPKQMDYYRWRGMSYVSQTEDFIARSTGRRTYPWRVMAITEDDTEMPVNNMVYALAEPNRIGDTSWIKPGKVAWDWWNDWNLRGVDFEAGINTATYLHYIDFAAKYGLQYVVLDEGWYDSGRGDLMNAIPAIDLPRIIGYARQKGIGIVLWTVFNVLDRHLEEACRKYGDMGVKGFKVDFLDRNDQTAVEMAERIAATAARHHLMLDYHGFYTPTGLSRTYPNVVNYEGVFGMEECRWAKKETDIPRYDVTFPFIRMMAGQVDFTPGAMRNGTRENWVECYQNPVSMGTRCHQAACYVVHDSPFTMLCDAPSNYEREPDYTKFIAAIPVVWDETRVLQGEMGRYIVSARRSGSDWYVGGQAGWDGREVVLPLSFLGDGQYEVTLLADGVNANHNAEDYTMTTTTQKAADRMTIRMASGGGFVMKCRKR